MVEIDHLHPKFAFVRLAKKAPRKQPRGRGLSTVAMSGAENAALAMVEAAYRHHGLNWRCINCEVPLALFGDAVRGARAMGRTGFICSIPHKVEIIKHLDGPGDSAAIMGTVNSIVRHGDKFIGEKTDGRGFVRGLSVHGPGRIADGHDH